MLGNVACFLPAVFNKIFQKYHQRLKKQFGFQSLPTIICAVPIMQKRSRGWGYSNFSCYGGLDQHLLFTPQPNKISGTSGILKQYI